MHGLGPEEVEVIAPVGLGGGDCGGGLTQLLTATLCEEDRVSVG